MPGSIYTNCLMVASFFVGLGPGGLHVDRNVAAHLLTSICLPGSSHGGYVPPSKLGYFQVGDSYDKENLTTFRGGSGGDAIHSIFVFRFL